MPPGPDAIVQDVVTETDKEDARWAELGVPTREVAHWKAQGFGPFEAALARGDGFTPLMVTHYRHQFLRTSRAWKRQGLDDGEGLRWHRAGFAVAEALRWRGRGVDVATARIRRDGYDHPSGRSGLLGRGRTGRIDQKGE